MDNTTQLISSSKKTPVKVFKTKGAIGELDSLIRSIPVAGKFTSTFTLKHPDGNLKVTLQHRPDRDRTIVLSIKKEEERALPIFADYTSINHQFDKFVEIMDSSYQPETKPIFPELFKHYTPYVRKSQKSTVAE